MEVLVEHDYTAKEPNELSIVKGDIIRDVIKKQDGWFEGILRDRRGLFPDNFVRILEKTAPPPTGASALVTLRNKKDATRIRQCRVIFSYRQDHEDELNLSVGDIIDIVGEEEEGWWRGVLKGKEGVFPSNFVEEIVATPFISPSNNSSSTASAGAAASTGISSGISSTSLSKSSGGVVGGGSGGGSRSGSKENLTGGDYLMRGGGSDVAMVGGVQTPPSLPAKAPKILCEVKFAYTAQNEDELTIKEGDLITLISKDGQDPGWWRGELNGVIGVFPDNFVTILPTLATATDATEDNRTNSGKIKSPHGTSIEPLGGTVLGGGSTTTTTGVPIKPSTITAQRKSHQEIPTGNNTSPSVFSNSSDKLVSSNTTANSANNNNNHNSNNNNSGKPQQPPPAVPSKKPLIPVKKSPSGSSAHGLLNSTVTVTSSSSSAEKSSSGGGGGGIFYGLKKKIADVVDGATGSKSMISSNKTESVTSETSDNNNVFDDVVRRPLLADVRASRPKAPGRRLPTTAIFKDSEPGIMNGSAEHSMVDGLTTNNTSSSLPSGNVQQQQGGSSSPEIDTTDSKPKLREWEKHKAPWLAEMKLNQAKRTSTSPGPPEHRLKLTPTPTNEKIIGHNLGDISTTNTSTTQIEEQQKSGNSVTTATSSTTKITSSSSSSSAIAANFEKFEKIEKLEKESLNSAIHSIVQDSSTTSSTTATNKSAFLSNRLSQRTPSSEFLNNYHQTTGTASNNTPSTTMNTSSSTTTTTTGNKIGMTPLIRNRQPGVTMPTRPQTIHSLLSTSSSSAVIGSSSTSGSSVITNESSSVATTTNLQHHKSTSSSASSVAGVGSSRISPLGHNKRPATMIPSAAGNGNNTGSYSEEKAPSSGTEATTPENIISHKQYSELLDRINKLEDLIRKREQQHSEAIEELKNKLQIEAELRMDLQVRLETYITENSALQQL